MKEDLLHYVWQTLRFDLADLKTTDGQEIRILNPGLPNANAGPDFREARIRIGDTLWAGQVEMHLRASDWYRHSHQEDPSYNNVILHVVYEEDRQVRLPGGQPLPCLELKNRIAPGLSKTYLKFLHGHPLVPCQHLLEDVPPWTKSLWLDRVLVDRLQTKTSRVRETLEHTGDHWDATLYRLLARNFGEKVNAEPFEWLAIATPLNLLLRLRDDIEKLEALLFGQGGFLDQGGFREDYPSKLKREYDFLRKKYGMEPIPVTAWKFLRLRPANFPTVRIAQFAALFHARSNFLGELRGADTLKDLVRLFQVEHAPYWRDHYRFDQAAREGDKKIGRAMVQSIAINTLVPYFFHYGQVHHHEPSREKAFRLLESLPPENNRIIRQWRELGWEPDSAYQSQALLHLRRQYCDRKQCLHCRVGHFLLKPFARNGD